jgi:hypothetical protein
LTRGSRPLSAFGMLGAVSFEAHMPTGSSVLIDTVNAMRPFVPAKNFEISKRFYADLGFRVEPLGDALAELHIGSHSFLMRD